MCTSEEGRLGEEVKDVEEEERERENTELCSILILDNLHIVSEEKCADTEDKNDDNIHHFVLLILLFVRNSVNMKHK